jgi:DNA polymerase III subunit epsilon
MLPTYGRFLTSYELVVAHNAAFDLRFINRELRLSGLPALTSPVYCTMKGYRALELGGSASLSAVCSQIKLARSGETHGAMEDAWLSMQIYLWLHGCPHQGRLPDSIPRTPSNFRDCEIRQRFASRRMPTWVVGSRGRRAAVSI